MAGKARLSTFPWLKDVGKDILGGVKQALIVAKGPLSLVPIPALPIAVDAVLGVIDACEKVSSNKDGLEELTRHLQSLLTYVLTPFVEARSTSDAITITDDLRLRVDQLCSQLIALANETNKLSKLSATRRFLRSSEVSGALQDLNNKIASALNAFRVGGDITKEILLRKVEKALTGMHAHMLDEAQRDRLDKLPHAPARYSNARTKATECLPNTREELLAEIYKWVEEEMKSKTPSMFIFWLCGLPGAGKSSIAKTVAKYLDDRRLLGASFFFSRDDDKCSNHELVMPTIARQLGFFNATVGLHISEFLKGQPDAGMDSMAYQLENLIIEPLREAHSSGALKPFAIAMDGLDECVNSAQAQSMLQLFASGFQKLPVPVLLFITSRPESYLESRFHSQSISPLVSAVRLHDIDEGTATLDITRYLETKLKDIASTHPACGDGTWLHSDDIERLSKQASCLFIYAVTAVTFIGDEDGIPEDRMLLLLDRRPLDERLEDNPYSLIDSLYLRILRDGCQGAKRATTDIRDIVGTIITLRYPLSSKALMEFMNIRHATLHGVLHRLSSVIIYSHSDEVRVRHQSFPDFLLRCTDPEFRIDTEVYHARLARLCLRLLLSDNLKRNMSPGVGPSTLNSDIPEVTKHVRAELAYACLHFAWHLVCGHMEDEDVHSQINTFLQTKLLNWFEALSLLGHLDTAFASLSQLDNWYRAFASPNLMTIRLIYDAQRFVQTFFHPISQNARQLYASALCFAPDCTLLRIYEEEVQTSNVKLLLGRDEQWSPCMRVIEGHSNRVNSVAFSSDNTRIVSGSDDYTVRVWDATSGTPQATLEGHYGLVNSVAFSSDDTRIVSWSYDKTIRVWDATSGALQATLRHTDCIRSVAFSSDDTRIVSGSDDKTIQLWDATSGTLQATLHGHAGPVLSVAFSSDNTRIVSGSEDATVRVWDAVSHTLEATLHGHANWVRSVAFSSDNTRIISGSWDYTIRVWDATSGALQATLEGHANAVTSVAFSSDDTRIVSGSRDNTVRLWDIPSGVLQAMLQGHSNWVNSVAFSSDDTRIVSGSDDKTIRVWDATSSALQATLHEYANIDFAAFSLDNTHVALSSAFTVHIWDATSGTFQTMLQGHTLPVLFVAFSSDNTRIVSGSGDNTVRVWDATSGALQAILEGHADWVRSVAFSSDHTRIVSGSDDHTARVWDAASGALQATLRGHVGWVMSVAFSSDDTRIVSGSRDNTIRVWDATSGALQATLQKDAIMVTSVAFSSDNTRIVSASRDETVRVWDPLSASQISVLHGAERLLSGSFALDDGGWIRDIFSDFKRVCWVPVSLREHLKELSRDETDGRLVFGSVPKMVDLASFSPVMFSVSTRTL